jgi:DNA-binding CsgD family transcriptional regulator
MKDAVKELKALPVNAVMLDAAGTIVAVNDTWKYFARRNGLLLPRFGIGSNYLQFCGSDGPYPSLFARDLKELLSRRRKFPTLIYPCHSPTEKRWFSLIGLPLSPDKLAGVALLHINLTQTLPPPFGTHKTQIGDSANLQAISATIERTVLETVSSQLDRMISDTDHSASCDDVDTDVLALSVLTKRQIEVLRHLGQGKSNKEIAEALFRSPHTIKLHVAAILQQLNMKSRTQAALLASKMYKSE